MSGTCKSRPDILLEIENLIDKIIQNSTILTLDWCPSHCNIEGNDMADKAVKS